MIRCTQPKQSVPARTADNRSQLSRTSIISMKRTRELNKAKQPAVASRKGKRPRATVRDYTRSPSPAVLSPDDDDEEEPEAPDDGDDDNDQGTAPRPAKRKRRPFGPRAAVIAAAVEQRFDELNISRAKLPPDYVPMRPDFYDAPPYQWKELPPNFRQIPFGTKNKPGLKVQVDPNWSAINYFELMFTPAVRRMCRKLMITIHNNSGLDFACRCSKCWFVKRIASPTSAKH